MARRIRSAITALCLLPAAWFPVAAQGNYQSVRGTVHLASDSSKHLSGAQVLLGERRTETNQAGQFRIDSLKPGTYQVTIRLIGFHPIRSKLPVLENAPTEVDYFMSPAPYLLPPVIADGSREGFYGTVGDTAYHPLAGARLDILGVGGGSSYVDSTGHFDYPNATGGTYMLRVTKPGYAERRLTVELDKGKGKQLSILLAPLSRARFSPGAGQALFDLGRRLAFENRRSRMTADEMQRFGSTPLCEIAKVRAMAGDPVTVILNGVTVYPEVSLCAWYADEIEMIEFPSEFKTGFGPVLTGPRGTAAQRGRPARRGPGFILLWEKQ